MKIRALLAALIAVLLLITANSSNHNNNQQEKSGSKNPQGTHLVAENFERADQPKSKSYSKATINFKSGAWLLDDALIGTSDKDIKNGSQSIRIRNKGKLSMQFDATNISRVNIKYAAYGNDKSSGWIIAVDTPNDNNIIPNWMNYVCTVRDIEKTTGYNLLSALPQTIQDTLEVKRFNGF